MSLTPQQVEVLRSSFRILEPLGATAADLFYRRLFELDPSVVPLFKGDMKEQGRKFMQVLATLVPRPQLHLPRLVCSSPSVVLAVTCVKESMPPAWELEPLCTWLPSSSTCVPRSWSLPETPLATTRSLVSCPVTSPLLSRTMRN